MARYFKLVVCPYESGKTPGEWVEKVRRQILDGKAHYGWSWIPMDPPHGTADLRVLREKWPHEGDERVVWRYTQFLIKHIKIGDRLIIQTAQPLHQFLIVEVTGPYGFLGTESDFNHYLECKAITEEYVNIDPVPQYVRHDLSKRGHYYQIYGEATIRYLDSIIERKSWSREDWKPKTHAHEKEETKDESIAEVIEIIRRRWPGRHFETFMKELIRKMPGVEVVGDSKDSHKGWDFLIRIQDPCAGDWLHDAVPVQCKNYKGKVNSDEPINDLKRCAKNSVSTIVYLFILGDVTENFKKKFAEAEQDEVKTGRYVQFIMMDQHEIARLYMKYMVS